MKIKIEIELDTLRDEQELSDLLELINRIRNKQIEDYED
jgi:hypothetical protein